MTLDVGGERRLTVSKSLLTSVPDSPLAAMFSGRHKVHERDGAVFIDRDPEVFSLLISYLRNGYRLPSIQDNFLK